MAALLAVALVGACSGDPTGDLRNGVSLLTASPSTLNVTLGKNKTTQITAVDDQGNDITSAFEVTDIGPGIEVKRDSTYLPIYLSDSTLSVPPEAPTFQYVVTATGLASSHFTVAVGDKSVTVPVLVAPDPLNIPISTLVSSGPNASDPVTITAPAGYQFSPTSTVVFDAGDAVTTGVSDDGTQLTVLAPPGSTSKGTVTGLFVPYFPSAIVSDSTDAAVAVNPVLAAANGTDDPNTAPELTPPLTTTSFTGILDGGNWSGADITGDGGLGAQYYKFEVTEAGDYTFHMNWPNDADLDPVVCFDAACSDGAFAGTGVDQPEEGTLTLQPGTYYFVAVLFDVGASATNPDYWTLQITGAPPTAGIKMLRTTALSSLKHRSK
jgi:hypothetical protein